MGGVFGTVVGALLIGVLRNGLVLLNVSPFIQQIVIGLDPGAGGGLRPVRRRAAEGLSGAGPEPRGDLPSIFGAIQALQGVDLELERGEVLGLMGDNGAGKSTLVKIIAGSFAPSAGEMRIDGEPVPSPGRSRRGRSGIEIVYQDLALCDNLTAALNVFLGRELTRASGRSASSTRRR